VAEHGDTGSDRRMRRLSGQHTRLVVGGLIVVAAVIYLVLGATRGGVAYYLTVDQILLRGPDARAVRVAGTVVDGSIVWDARELILRFEIVDEGCTLRVEYHGGRPDMLRDGAEVVAEGRLTEASIFEAHQLILKCPSKYAEATPDG